MACGVIASQRAHHCFKLLGSTPLLVVTAPRRLRTHRAETALWKLLQDELAALSTNSAHQHTIGTTHDSLVYEQQHAKTTAIAIVEFVNTLR